MSAQQQEAGRLDHDLAVVSSTKQQQGPLTILRQLKTMGITDKTRVM
jgi:hypothetical protein